MRMSKQFRTISGGYSGKLEDMRSFARWSSKPRAFSFSISSITQNQRSIERQAFPEGAWFSHEGSRNSADLLGSCNYSVCDDRRTRKGYQTHEARVKSGKDYRHDLESGVTQQKPADLALAYLCVPGAVHSGGNFHCDPVSRIRLGPRVQDQSMSCRALPDSPYPPSPAPAAGQNFHAEPLKCAGLSGVARLCMGFHLPLRMVPSPAFAVAHKPPLTGGNPVTVAQGAMRLSYGCRDGGKRFPSRLCSRRRTPGEHLLARMHCSMKHRGEYA